MHIFGICLIVFGIISIFHVVYIFRRNEWVLKTRINFIFKCHENISKHLELNGIDNCPSVTELVNLCLPSYYKCVFGRFTWNFEKLVENRELYDRWYKGIQ